MEKDMRIIVRNEIVTYRGSAWEIHRIRHDDGTWTGSATLLSAVPKGAKSTRHFHSSALDSTTVRTKPLDWIRNYVDQYVPL